MSAMRRLMLVKEKGGLSASVVLLSFVLLATASSALELRDATLAVGTFNIQTFGRKKFENSLAIDVIVQILSRFDLILIQEIRDVSETAFPELVELLNRRHGRLYTSFAGKRLGRHQSKEQYGFVYRNDKLQVTHVHDWNDENDEFERPPIVARFTRLTYSGKQHAFSFIGIHAKAKNIKALEEMNNLVDVWDWTQAKYGPNVVIAGDLNADCSFVRKKSWKDARLRNDDRFHWLTHDHMKTNVHGDCAYDRVIVTGTLVEHSCCAQVVRYDEMWTIPHELVKAVSDHYPVGFYIN